MNLKHYLGIALVADVVGLVFAVVAGVDTGPLDELAIALAAGLAGATVPQKAGA